MDSILLIIFVTSIILGISSSFMIYVGFLFYCDKYAQKAELLLEDPRDDEIYLSINPTLTQKEIKKNKLITFNLLNYCENYYNGEYINLLVSAKLNNRRKYSFNSHFLTLYTYHNGQMIYSEKLRMRDCKLVVKYFFIIS